MDDPALEFKPGNKILIVDDDPRILASLTRLLEDEDFEVVSAESAEAALEILNDETIDLVVSDMRMPNMDGATFLAKVANQWPDTLRILLTGFADLTSTIKAINEGDIFQYISKPWDDDQLIVTLRKALDIRHLREHNRHLIQVRDQQNIKLKELTEKQESIIKSRTEELEQTASQLDVAYQELQDSYFQTVPLLANLIEMNERHKKNHAQRVATITKTIADGMDLSDHEKRQFYIGAILHDIGKIGIEPVLLGKSVSDMSNLESSRYQQHTLLGESSLLSFDPLKDASHIVRSHHERYDGKGFPGKLSGTAIPLGARIVAVANDFDNLQLPNNFFGKMLTTNQAHEYILHESGKRYDPVIVEVFDRVFDDLNALLLKDKEIMFNLDKVRPGMILSQDLVNHHGLVMLASGKTLTEVLIKKLHQFEKAFNTKLQIVVKSAPSANANANA